MAAVKQYGPALQYASAELQGDREIVMEAVKQDESALQCASSPSCRCPDMKDKGVIAMAEGCPKLQSVNLAGCKTISELAVCAIADHCKAIQMLNVTGCEDVTENGMKELLRGLPFTDLARTYIGFKPKNNFVDAVAVTPLLADISLMAAALANQPLSRGLPTYRPAIGVTAVKIFGM